MALTLNYGETRTQHVELKDVSDRNFTIRLVMLQAATHLVADTVLNKK